MNTPYDPKDITVIQNVYLGQERVQNSNPVMEAAIALMAIRQIRGEQKEEKPSLLENNSYNNDGVSYEVVKEEKEVEVKLLENAGNDTVKIIQILRTTNWKEMLHETRKYDKTKYKYLVILLDHSNDSDKDVTIYINPIFRNKFENMDKSQIREYVLNSEDILSNINPLFNISEKTLIVLEPEIRTIGSPIIKDKTNNSSELIRYESVFNKDNWCLIPIVELDKYFF